MSDDSRSHEDPVDPTRSRQRVDGGTSATDWKRVAEVFTAVAAAVGAAVVLLKALWNLDLPFILATAVLLAAAGGLGMYRLRRNPGWRPSFSMKTVPWVLVLLGVVLLAFAVWKLLGRGHQPPPVPLPKPSPSSSIGNALPPPPGACPVASATEDEATVASSSKVPTRVRFTDPKRGTPPTDVASTVCVEGTVENLLAGHDLWILSRPHDPSDPGTFYFVVGSGAVQVVNGFWSAADYSVGDESDKGKGFDYFAVDAGDDTCDNELRVAAQNVENGVPVRRVRFDVENICTVLKPPAPVTFKK